MRTLPDRQLTPNFRLYEFIEAHPTRSQEFIAMNWRNIAEFSEENAQRLAEFLQRLVTIINQRYKSDMVKAQIGIRITSAFRCKEWELRQGRSGESIHTDSLAVDIQPVNVSPALGVRILAELHREFRPLKTGHQGGLALKKPTFNSKRQITKMGFLHLDFGAVRRWNY